MKLIMDVPVVTLDQFPVGKRVKIEATITNAGSEGSLVDQGDGTKAMIWQEIVRLRCDVIDYVEDPTR